jgi:hypothetical protein
VYAKPVFLIPACNFGPAYGECRLLNTYPRPVNCEFIVHGQTRLGSHINGFQYIMLYQGMFAWYNVQANNPYIDPIIFLTANANCNTFGR